MGGGLAVEKTRRDEAVRVTHGWGVRGGLGWNWGLRRRIVPIQEWVEEGRGFKMVWEDSSVGVLLKLGRGSIDQEPCVKNLSFVRRQGWGVISKVGGRWKGFSPEGGNPCSD